MRCDARALSPPVRNALRVAMRHRGAFSFARSDLSLKPQVFALELGRRLGDVRSLADGR